MWIDNLTDKTSVICIAVSGEQELQRELQIVIKKLSGKSDYNVIISLANIEMLTSSSLSGLLILRHSLSRIGRQLILCKVGFPVKGVFRTAGLNSLFHFATDMLAAQTMIQQTKRPEIQKTTP
ncbi:MAG: STAS domain-containing protein [Planctomycetes bacterium]|nr:STAS domain-containing protein [Planctomycetota bacterium]